ncbi:hypothetical protein M569_00987, partial [Genlisea aurea]
STSAACPRQCGNATVKYPFGFSDGCGIRLNCSGGGEIGVGGFDALNVTGERISIGLPIRCDRSIEKLRELFGPNFAPTWKNEFLLENCSESVRDCLIPSRFLGAESCGGYNRSCYAPGSADGIAVEFLNYTDVLRRGDCGVLLSSMMVDWSPGSSIALEVGTVELGWWLDGACDCDGNASCTVVRYGGRVGYRCNCNQGYVGDGFSAGNGCRRASDSSSGRRGRSKKVVAIVGGALAGALSTAMAAVACHHAKKRTAARKNRITAKRLVAEALGKSTIPLYPYREIHRATRGFSESQMLGTGAYGTVYAGKLRNDEWVAIKRIKHRDDDGEGIAQVMNEIKLLSSVSHPNLVRLLGCSFENGEQILVYEYMPNGTLAQHLQRERGPTLPWSVRLAVAAQTARAVAYLHSAVNPPIYHRDIKSSNILLDYDFNSKVADFGLSRFGMAAAAGGDESSKSHVSTAPQGTPGYVDPQYHQNFHLSDRSDVYSFGVVLVEIVSGMKAVDFTRPRSDVNLAALAVDKIGKGRVEEIVDPFISYDDAWTVAAVHKVAELAFRCLAFDYHMRPSMVEVAEELEMVRVGEWATMAEENGGVRGRMTAGSSGDSSCSS